MLDKLDNIVKNYEEIANKIADPAVIADNKTWKKLAKEHADLTPLVDKYNELKKCIANLEDAEQLLKGEKDAELVALYEEEIESCKENKVKLEEELKILLLPKDENDDKNVIVEIRAGAGGEEAGLFGAELVRMYMMYAEHKRYKVETVNMNESELGGIKEAVFQIKGNGAYSNLKYESGEIGRAHV